MNETLKSHTLPSGQRLELAQGDITDESVDAIVNAANAQLIHGGGLAGAIVRKGGPTIQAESSAWVNQHGPITHAEPGYTHAGNLPCRAIIHAVGPVWGDGNEDEKLRAAITGSLLMADKLRLASIAFPAISTGIFGFPAQRAARVILSAIHAYTENISRSTLELIRLVLYDQPTLQAFLKVWEGDDQLGA
jgi:O-acetyl-ADP-ribose deacetylase (regulator of RNase III)